MLPAGATSDHRVDTAHDHAHPAGRRQLPAWTGPAAVAAGALAGCALLAGVDPNDGGFPACPFHAVTGWWCPGCGTLRATHALTRGHLGEAAGLNVLWVLAVPVLVYVWVAYALRSVGGPRLPRLERLPRSVLAGLLVVTAAFWVARNLPSAPFSGLAP
ncbi:MAG: DUF2752 domain-containing protein [Acidimicrobiales bacterium]|nr:DUF2752 domain-containing protein [Acidimicrobiales bacterium]